MPSCQVLGILLWCISWADLFYSFYGLVHGRAPPPIFFITPLVVGITMVSVGFRVLHLGDGNVRGDLGLGGHSSGKGMRTGTVTLWERRSVGWFPLACSAHPQPHPQMLATVLIQYERLQGVQSSGVLIVFWFLCVLCAIVPFCSKILSALAEVRGMRKPGAPAPSLGSLRVTTHITGK